MEQDIMIGMTPRRDTKQIVTVALYNIVSNHEMPRTGSKQF